MLPMLMLLGLSLALLLVAPIVLTTGRWQVRHPRIALTLWFGAFFAGCTAAGASVLVAVLTAVGVDERMSHAEGLAATVIAWLSLIGIGAIVASSWHGSRAKPRRLTPCGGRSR